MTDKEMEHSCEMARFALSKIEEVMLNKPYIVALNAQMIIIDQLFTDSCSKLSMVNKIDIKEAVQKMSSAMIQSTFDTVAKEKKDPTDT